MTETLILACRECGAEVRRALPDDLTAKYVELARRLPAMCDDCQAIDDEQERLHAARQAEQLADRQFRTRLSSSGLPVKHHRSLNDLVGSSDQTGLLECERWVRDGGGLYLWGPWGTGKTTLAGAAAFDMLHRRPLLWMPASELLADLGSDWGSDRHARALDVLTGDYALCLDDIDKVRRSEYAIENLHQVIDQRVEHERPLLLTANVSIGALRDRYGDAIASRLVGFCRQIKVDGADRRLGGAVA